MKKLALVFTILVSGFLFTTHALASSIGFAGIYDPSNWTTTNTNSNGYVNTSGVPDSIQIVGSDNGSWSAGDTDYTITSPENGMVSFDWSFTTTDWSALYDPFGYFFNDVFVQLTDDNLINQSGGSNFTVSAGDVFGFRIHSIDNIYGPGVVEISDFNAPVPEPGTLFLLGSGLLGLAGSTRRKFKK